MKRYCFLLNFGYAEDSYLGLVPFSSEKEFDSVKDAFIDLSKFFLHSYMEKYKEEECCTSSRSTKGANLYCAKCGNFISENEFDEEGFLNFLIGIGTSTIDSYAVNFSLNDDCSDWNSIYEFDSFNNTHFVYEAERCIAMAVGHNIYDDRSIDDLFNSLNDNNIRFY